MSFEEKLDKLDNKIDNIYKDLSDFKSDFSEFKGKIEVLSLNIHPPGNCNEVKKLKEVKNRIEGGFSVFRIVIILLQSLWGVLFYYLLKK